MYKSAFIVLLLFGLGMSVTLGQQAGSGAATLALSGEGDSAYLTDSQGMSLYVYLEDEGGSSTCYGRCEQNLVPFITQGDPIAGEGVQADLVGTSERQDGSSQVTYNGWPLYTFARDEAPGETKGQGVGDLLYMVSASGEALQDTVTAVAESSEDGDLTEALAAEGEGLFTSVCATCHGDEGQGIVGPRLDGNQAVGRSSNVINTILYGRTHGGMPAFGDRFSDREVAAVGTYVRNAWSNDFGAISEEEVGALR